MDKEQKDEREGKGDIHNKGQFVVHNLRSVEIYLRLCAIIQTGAPEAQLAQLSSWRYGRGARTIYFAGFFSDSNVSCDIE